MDYIWLCSGQYLSIYAYLLYISSLSTESFSLFLLFSSLTHHSVTDYEATCVLEDINSSNVRGTIRLTPSDAGVHVSVSARDFVASSIHGFHVHAFGDVSDTAGGSKTGGHFNPSNTAHGCDPEVRHAGDLGNIEASTGGVVNANVTTHLLTYAKEKWREMAGVDNDGNMVKNVLSNLWCVLYSMRKHYRGNVMIHIM